MPGAYNCVLDNIIYVFLHLVRLLTKDVPSLSAVTENYKDAD